MYSPAEINKAYRLKTSIVYMVPMLVVALLLLYYPPKILMAITGTTKSVQLQVIEDSLQAAKVQLQRKDAILQTTRLQLQHLQKQENAIAIVAGDGLQLHLQKPQFKSWAEWSKNHKQKSFSDFRNAENLYYKAQIDSIWSQLRKGDTDE